jgi:hypothetical protein
MGLSFVLLWLLVGCFYYCFAVDISKKQGQKRVYVPIATAIITLGPLAGILFLFFKDIKAVTVKPVTGDIVKIVPVAKRNDRFKILKGKK